MNETSEPFHQMTLWDTGKATSSLASADGPTLSASPDGLTTDQYGPEVAPASPTATPESEKATPTTATSGLGSFGSSASVDLTRSLANKCRELLGTDGSMEFSETWKEKATPAGRRYWEHTASARRTSDKGCSGWPTCRTADGDKGIRSAAAPAAELARKGTGADLPTVIATVSAPWATPASRDYKDAACANANVPVNALLGRQAVSLSPWPTTSANQFEPTDVQAMLKRREKIKAQVINGNGFGLTLAMAMVAHLGIGSTSSIASTTNPAVLNPGFSRWLMGFPRGNEILGWDTCSPNWSSWATIQKLLGEYSAKREETASGG
jgi:hypothetical protein